MTGRSRLPSADTVSAVLDPVLNGPVDRFITELAPEVARISPQILESDLALEAYNLVAAFIDVDGMHSEDELAFVPGHEIEHIDHIMPWSACRSKRNCTSWIWTLLPIGESPARDVAGRICEGRGK